MNYFTPETDPLLFGCSCGRPECDAPKPHPTLIQMLNIMRGLYGVAISVNSGPRCAHHNGEVGGEADSAHLTGEAADLACHGGEARFAMVEAARHAGFKRIGVGFTLVHVDMADRPAALWPYEHK